MKRILTTAVFFVSTIGLAFANEITVEDFRGNKVVLPNGTSSFVDQVVETNPGSRPHPTNFLDPKAVLGPPDFYYDASGNSRNDLAFSLGCGGHIILQFLDNTLTDVEGPDLYVFESGRDTEAMFLEVSNDRKNWEDVGIVDGDFAAIDIGLAQLKDEDYRYIKLTDQRQGCHIQGTPGADIDSVAAIGSFQRWILEGALLFDLDSAELRPEAKLEIDRILERISQVSILAVSVDGHTDSSGSDQYNLTLGQERAQAVSNYMRDKMPMIANSIRVQSFGESRPTASNSGQNGRQLNRRVEITLLE